MGTRSRPRVHPFGTHGGARPKGDPFGPTPARSNLEQPRHLLRREALAQPLGDHPARSSTRFTVVRAQEAPRDVGTPRAFRAAAISAKVRAPVACTS
jgi:hypothetical protein